MYFLNLQGCIERFFKFPRNNVPLDYKKEFVCPLFPSLFLTIDSSFYSNIDTLAVYSLFVHKRRGVAAIHKSSKNLGCTTWKKIS